MSDAIKEQERLTGQTKPPQKLPNGLWWLDFPLTLDSSEVALLLGTFLLARKGKSGRFLGRLFMLAALLPWLYLLVLRPWHRRWGATEEEVKRTLPGDDLLLHPMNAITRAITINAPPEAIWPWLVQMGYGRAGWYSYDFLDNSGTPSANRIIPELQNLRAGDIMPSSPPIRLGKTTLVGPEDGFKVEVIEPNHYLVLTSSGIGPWRQPNPDAVWTFYLEPIDENSTRLIERLRNDSRPPFSSVLTYPVFEPGDFLMMRKQMLTLKRLVEVK